jgi:hypothetical protein
MLVLNRTVAAYRCDEIKDKAEKPKKKRPAQEHGGMTFQGSSSDEEEEEEEEGEGETGQHKVLWSLVKVSLQLAGLS